MDKNLKFYDLFQHASFINERHGMDARAVDVIPIPTSHSKLARLSQTGLRREQTTLHSVTLHREMNTLKVSSDGRRTTTAQTLLRTI